LNISAHLIKPTNQASVIELENSIFGEDGSKMVAEDSGEGVVNEKAKK
jgi:hypothetical protein